MQPGTHLNHYEILTAIGKGGMGEVWKAKDTKLGPWSFRQDAARRIWSVNPPGQANHLGGESIR